MRPLVDSIHHSTSRHASSTKWETFAPFLTDEHLREYLSTVPDKVRSTFSQLFEVAEVLGRSPTSRILATSLFWKNVNKNTPDLPPLNRHIVENARTLGLVKRHDPWTHYVLPVIRGAGKLARLRPDVTVRVYLANDLSFLLPDLVDNCEVYLMRDSSIRHSPGALWRYLSLAPEGEIVTIIDADMLEKSGERILAYSDTLEADSVRTWRYPSSREVDANRFFVYRPIMGWGFGTKLGLDAHLLLPAFVWHYIRGTFPRVVTLPNIGELRHFAMEWPGYNIDEWFLSAVVYPRFLPFGFLTLTGKSTAPTMFPLDIDLTIRCNSGSRLAQL